MKVSLCGSHLQLSKMNLLHLRLVFVSYSVTTVHHKEALNFPGLSALLSDDHMGDKLDSRSLF